MDFPTTTYLVLAALLLQYAERSVDRRGDLVAAGVAAASLIAPPFPEDRRRTPQEQRVIWLAAAAGALHFLLFLAWHDDLFSDIALIDTGLLAFAAWSRPAATLAELLRTVIVGTAVFLVIDGVLTLGTALADHDRGQTAVGTALAVAPLLTLVAIRLGTNRIPGLRRLREAAPISWMGLLLLLVGLALNLAPTSGEATVTATITAPRPDPASTLILGALPFALIGIAAVGPVVRRSPTEALQRLGLLPLRIPWWPVGVVVGLACLPAIAQLSLHLAPLLDHLVPHDCVVQQQQVARSIQDVSRTWYEQLGIAVAAGVCEETLFRGALQPRFGILLTSALWATFHLQYTCHGFPSVANLYILLLGLVFGLLRKRAGLSAAILAHTAYDAAILLQVPLPFT